MFRLRFPSFSFLFFPFLSSSSPTDRPFESGSSCYTFKQYNAHSRAVYTQHSTAQTATQHNTAQPMMGYCINLVIFFPSSLVPLHSTRQTERIPMRQNLSSMVNTTSEDAGSLLFCCCTRHDGSTNSPPTHSDTVAVLRACKQVNNNNNNSSKKGYWGYRKE